MIILAVTYVDGTHSHAWGTVEHIEGAIELFARRGEIADWSITDSAPDTLE